MLKLPTIKRSVMLRLCLGFLTVLLFQACSSKEQTALLSVYIEKNNYHKNLQKTEKGILYNGNISVAIVTASYQFTETADKNDTRPEVFIVAVQFSDDENKTMNFVNKNVSETSPEEYILTLNGALATKVESLSKDDKALKDISFITPWGRYYKVTYAHTNLKQFKLNFENVMYGKSALSFAKVAKFVYTKKSF